MCSVAHRQTVEQIFTRTPMVMQRTWGLCVSTAKHNFTELMQDLALAQT